MGNSNNKNKKNNCNEIIKIDENKERHYELNKEEYEKIFNIEKNGNHYTLTFNDKKSNLSQFELEANFIRQLGYDIIYIRIYRIFYVNNEETKTHSTTFKVNAEDIAPIGIEDFLYYCKKLEGKYL